MIVDANVAYSKHDVDVGRRRAAIIVALSVLGGGLAAYIIPHFISWVPYDYSVYIQGARMVRAGQDPYAVLPYWYPLPIVIFTTMPWSFLPDQFAWAFAFIPLGLLHLRYGKSAVLWWLFFPLLINVAFAQAEGWLVIPLCWILDGSTPQALVGILGVMFKPAYGMLIVPERIMSWIRERRWKDITWLLLLGGVMCGAAFLFDPGWPMHWISAILRRGDNPELIMRNMTIWAFISRGGMWLVALMLLVTGLVVLSWPLLRQKGTRGYALLATSLFIFPGLNPVSSMMVMPLVETPAEIMVMVVVSWITAGLDVLVGGFGGVYLIIVLAALALRTRRYLVNAAMTP